MAKLFIEFDTVEKTMSATIDGKNIENVAEVYVSRSYTDEDDYSCSVTTSTEDEENDMRKMTRMVASLSVEGKKAKDTACENKLHPDFLNIPCQTKTQADIEKFFSKD